VIVAFHGLAALSPLRHCRIWRIDNVGWREGDNQPKGSPTVMAGLDAAIQAPHSLDKPRAINKAQFLDCRVEPGNDGERYA
jgi:hypothetical protein